MQKDNLNNYSEDTVITNLIDFWQDLRWTKEMDSRQKKNKKKSIEGKKYFYSTFDERM